MTPGRPSFDWPRRRCCCHPSPHVLRAAVTKLTLGRLLPDWSGRRYRRRRRLGQSPGMVSATTAVTRAALDRLRPHWLKRPSLPWRCSRDSTSAWPSVFLRLPFFLLGLWTTQATRGRRDRGSSEIQTVGDR